MKTRCKDCNLSWGVSVTEEVLQKIKEDKYICPYCTTEKKRARRRNRQGSKKKIT